MTEAPSNIDQLLDLPKEELARRLDRIIQHKLNDLIPSMYKSPGELYQDGWNDGMETAQRIALKGK